MKLSDNVYAKTDRIVYANAYTRKRPVHPEASHRLFVIFDNGERVTLHAEPARQAAKALSLEFTVSH